MDLISRQAAKNKKVYSEERHEYVVPVAEIDWLPSAQPEVRTEMSSENDTISRQAVNDMLKELTKKASGRATLFNSAYAYYRGAISDVYYGVKGLPSAQPEIIRCKDCKYFDPLTEDFDYNFCDAWAGGTNEDMFCGFAERRQDADSSGNMSGTQKELKCTETHS